MLILNNRINSHDIPYSIKYSKHIKTVEEIAKAVETGVSTIKI
jgi:predicted Ser/Thr protein kinase